MQSCDDWKKKRLEENMYINNDKTWPGELGVLFCISKYSGVYEKLSNNPFK